MRFFCFYTLMSSKQKKTYLDGVVTNSREGIEYDALSAINEYIAISYIG